MNPWVLPSILISFFITYIIGKKLIPYLHKLHFGQTILDIGPRWHKNKEGTPTMGGIMFITGIVISVAICFISAVLYDRGLISTLEKIHDIKLFYGLLMALAFGLMGFLDDYIKVVKKRNLGLTAIQKLIIQFFIAIVFLIGIYLAGDHTTSVLVPFFGNWELGILYYPLCAIGIVFIVNSVNLTDGIDGLASSVTLVYSIAFCICSMILSVTQVTILSLAVCGGCLGFLMYNFYPAKVFMGDTGSMFLGGCIVAMAFGINFPLVLIFTGFIYIAESLSVVMQVISFKTTGKRIFKMSPIHHHFEMSGFSEIKIVVSFSIVALAGGILAVLATLRL